MVEVILRKAHVLVDLYAVRCGIVLQEQQAQQDGESGGGGNGACHRIRGEVRAKHVEFSLRELEALPVCQVGGVDHHVRSPAARAEILKGFVLEEFLVVVLRCEVYPGEVGRRQAKPVHRRGGSAGQPALYVLLQEALAEIDEQPLAEQSVVGSGEGPSGDRGDAVHLIKEAFFAAFPNDACFVQFLQYGIAERGCSRAPARERQANEQLVRVLAAGLFVEDVGRTRGLSLQLLVELVVSAARQCRDCNGKQRGKGPTPRDQSSPPWARPDRYRRARSCACPV